MRINFSRFISILVLSGAISACATDGASKPLTETEKQMNYIYTSSQKKAIYFLNVPSPNNIISEKIMLAAMALDGESTAVDALDGYLKKNASIHIGIVGKSQAINVMTVKQSLKNMASQPAKGTIYLVAGVKEKEELNAVNQNKNINIVVFSDPN